MMHRSEKNKEIERLRAVAILMTIISHLGIGMIPAYFLGAWAGVDLFFVISGFVITNSLTKLLVSDAAGQTWISRLETNRPALKIFFVRRIYRIVPLALTAMVFSVLVSGFTASTNIWTALARESLTVVSGIYNYALAAGLPSGHFGVFWSLAVEEHFYILLPFAFIAAKDNAQRVLLTVGAIALVVIVIRPIALHGVDLARWTNWRVTSHTRFDALAVGVLIALLRQRGWGVSMIRPTKSITALSFCLIALLWFLPKLSASPTSAEYAISSIFIANWLVSGALVFFASLQTGQIMNVSIFSPMFEYIGSRSYALYLSHLPTGYIVRLYINPNFSGASNFLRITVLTCMVFAVAEILHRCVELPFIAAGHRRVFKIQRTMVEADQDSGIKKAA